jgi:hypothetical protein
MPNFRCRMKIAVARKKRPLFPGKKKKKKTEREE